MEVDAAFVLRFWSQADLSNGADSCWEWMGCFQGNGYGQIRVPGQRTWIASRLAFVLSGGILRPGDQVCHSCDRRSCVNPSHLWAGTGSDNMHDAIAKGRYVSNLPPTQWGASAPNAKLTEDQARDIRRRRALGESGPHLAALFGVSTTQIYGIANRNSWRHLSSASGS